jgi:hypothetical protein
MRNYKVGDHVQVKLSGGRIVQATIKAILETTDGMRLQVSFGSETELIYPWQMFWRIVNGMRSCAGEILWVGLAI